MARKKKAIIKPVEHFDEADLMINGEIVPCITCGGDGWDSWFNPHTGDEGAEECPDCLGEGVVGYMEVEMTPKQSYQQALNPFD